MTSIQRRIVGFSASMVLAGFALVGFTGTAHAHEPAEEESSTGSSTENSALISNLGGEGGLINIFIGNNQVRE